MVLKNYFPLSVLLGSIVLATGVYAPSFAAPPVVKSVAKNKSPESATDRLNAALKQPALQIKPEARAKSVSKLAAYVAARKNVDKAFAVVVHEAKAARTAVPRKPFADDRGTGYYEAHLQELRERAFPRDYIDTDAILRAEDHRDRMPATQGVMHSVSIAGIDAQTLAARPELYRKSVATGKGIVKGAAARDANRLAGAQWQFVGPRSNTATAQEAYYGPIGIADFSGRVNGMAVSPTDANVVFVATATGGVWKTTDAGLTWSPIADAALARQETGSIAIDPQNVNNMLVGLGDAQAGEGDGFGRGMLRSTDGGVSWTPIPVVAQVPGEPAKILRNAVSAIVYNPDVANLVVATTRGNQSGGHRFRSTDGGVTWTQIADPLANNEAGMIWSSLSLSQKDAATNGRYYYATAMSDNTAQAGLWRSADDGATWTNVALPAAYNGGTVAYNFDNGFRAVASATNSNIVYVLRASDKSLIKGVRNPANDTYTWTEISGTAGQPGYFSQVNWGQLFYNLYLNCAAQTVNGVSKDALYVSLLSISAGLGVSDDNWTPNWVDFGKAFDDAGTRTHADNHFSVVAPSNPNRVYIGNDGGFNVANYDPAKSVTPALDTWTFEYGRNANIGTMLFYQADFHPYNVNFMLGGLQDNGGTVSRGDLNKWNTEAGGDGSGVGQDAANPLRSYILTNNLSVTQTQDGWANKVSITPAFGTGDARPLIGYAGNDPNYPNAFYLGSNYLWRFSPLKNRWESRLGNTDLTGATDVGIRAITVASKDSKTVYAGTPNGRLWVSFDAGKTWTNLQAASGSTLPNRAVTSISVSPTNANDILVTLSGTGGGHVYRCADTSVPNAAFTDLSANGATGLPDVPFNTLARDFTDPDNIWFAGSDIGVFQTLDAGVSWANATQPLGLPAVSIRTLKAMPGTGYLMAATHGRSIWRLQLVESLPVNTAGVKPRYITPASLGNFASSSDGTFFFNVPFTFGNIGGTDATAVTVTKFSVKVNGVDAIPEPSVSLPTVLGRAQAGAGTVTGRFEVRSGVLNRGTRYPATVSVSGTYLENGKVEYFDYNGRIDFAPRP